jgi:hypothetical protein
MESSQCVAFDQAENRLHVQKAVMVWLLSGSKGSKIQGQTRPGKERSTARRG